MKTSRFARRLVRCWRRCRRWINGGTGGTPGSPPAEFGSTAVNGVARDRSRRTFIETGNKTRRRCAYRGYAGISGSVPGRPDISRRQQLGPGGDRRLGGGEESAGEVGRRFGKGSGWIASRDHIHHSS